jgi:hypothetical protein
MMLVREAHDIAEGLQQKIERLPEVERVWSQSTVIHFHVPGSFHRHSSTSIMIAATSPATNTKLSKLFIKFFSSLFSILFQVWRKKSYTVWHIMITSYHPINDDNYLAS